jgi:hypothetical protein
METEVPQDVIFLNSISGSDSLPSKHPDFMSVTDAGMLNLLNRGHPWKAFSSMVETDEPVSNIACSRMSQ